MFDQDMESQDLDVNFTDTVEILNRVQLPYWVCNGTLLGLVRDQVLIPWDHDIDIAFWFDDNIKSTLVDLMKPIGFQLISDGEDYDFLSFTRAGGRDVDFNFYRMSEDKITAYSEWFVARSRFSALLLALANAKDQIGRKEKLFKLIAPLSFIFATLCRLIKHMGLLYKSAGYITPLEFISVFDCIEIRGLKVRVPEDPERVLEFVYGSDWRTPIQNYNWVEESSATVVSNNRFNDVMKK